MIRLGRIVVLGLALVVGFSLLMILAYSLPEAPIRSHMGTSLGQLELEGHPYVPLVGLYSLMPDNFTDAVMLNESISAATSPVEAAFGNYARVIEDPTGEWMPLESLRQAIAGSGGEQRSYARYWHGYQVALRPLLMVFDYRAIRWLNAILLAACVAAVSVLLRYRLGMGTAVALLIALGLAGIVIVPMSIQFSGVFYVALAGSAFVALGMDRRGAFRFGLETFFVLGALTCFVDLLTAPVLTLGIPLVVLTLGRMSSEEDSTFNRQLLCSAKMSLAWTIGYLGCWISKWTLSSLVLGRNLFGEVVANVVYRANGAEAGVVFERGDTIVHNVAMLFPLFGFGQSVGLQWGVVAAACAIPVALALVVMVQLARHPRTDGRRSRILGLLPVGVLPIAWYLVANNHSAVHYWFTYRALAVTVFAAVAGALYLFDPGYLRGLKAGVEGRLRRPPEGGGSAAGSS